MSTTAPRVCVSPSVLTMTLCDHPRSRAQVCEELCTGASSAVQEMRMRFCLESQLARDRPR